MLKSLYTISHFAMLVVMMDFLVLFFGVLVLFITLAMLKKKTLTICSSNPFRFYYHFLL